MSPAKVTKIEMMPRRHTARVYVPEDQLSLAIGKAGQNVRLAAKLTGWKIDVAGATVVAEGVEGGAGIEELEGVGEKTAQALHDAGFSTPADIVHATVDELTKVEGIGPKTAEKILESAKKLTGAEKTEEEIIEKAAEAASGELAEQEHEENVAETEPAPEKEVEEELQPKDFE